MLSPLISIKPTDTIPILVVFLAVALDLLRLLFRSVTRLLEPKEAVWRLEMEARKALERLHKGFERMANLLGGPFLPKNKPSSRRNSI